MQKLSLIIPAHNEQERIGKTLAAYGQFFGQLKADGTLDYEIVVVLNGCTDDTLAVVMAMQKHNPAIIYLDLDQGGKGYAIKMGFLDALQRASDLIGFVDADMATQPEDYYNLITHIDGYDGIIASRYSPNSQIWPARPWIKRWGSRLIYEPLVGVLFGLWFKDLQCGAKLFKRKVIEKVAPCMTIRQWAFDVELLYLCKRFGFTIKEFPTVWRDQAGSKLTIGGGFKMLSSIFKLKWKFLFTQQS